MATRWRDALGWVNGSSEEPLRLVRLVGGGLQLFGTVVALALSGVARVRSCRLAHSGRSTG